MKKLILIIIFVIIQVLPVTLWAADRYQSLTISTTAVGFSDFVLGYHKASCTHETAEVRFRVDGQNPTTTEGHVLSSGDELTLSDSGDIRKFRAIRTGATDGVLKCSFY